MSPPIGFVVTVILSGHLVFKSTIASMQRPGPQNQLLRMKDDYSEVRSSSFYKPQFYGQESNIPKIYLQITFPINNSDSPEYFEQSGHFVRADLSMSTQLTTPKIPKAFGPTFIPVGQLAPTVVILGTFTLLTLIGNIMVIVAIATHAVLRNSVVNRTIASLAVAGLLVSLFVMPLAILNEISEVWFLGDAMCDAFVFLDVAFCTASILHLLTIAIDRYLAATRIVYFRHRPRAITIMLAFSWGMAGFLSCLPLLGWRDPQMKSSIIGMCMISGDPWFAVFGTCIAFYIPTALIVAVYVKIYIEVKQRIQKRLKASSLGKVKLNTEPKKQESIGEDETGENVQITLTSPLASLMFQRNLPLQQMSEQQPDGDKGVVFSNQFINIRRHEFKAEVASNEPPTLVEGKANDDEDPPSDSGTIYDNLSQSEIERQRKINESERKAATTALATEIPTLPPQPADDFRLNTQSVSFPVLASQIRKQDNIDVIENSQKGREVASNTSQKYSILGTLVQKVQNKTRTYHQKRLKKIDEKNRRVSVAMALMAVAVDHCDLSLARKFSSANSNLNEENNSKRRYSTFLKPDNIVERTNSNASARLRSQPASRRNSFKILQKTSSVAAGDRSAMWKQREHKTAALLLTVTSCFIICWLPYFILELITPLCHCDDYLPPPPVIRTSVTWLGYCNSLLNPIIYTVTSADFRLAFKNLLRLS